VNIVDHPRFVRGIELFNAGDYFEAGECFEDLFFEGVRDEPDFIRVFLQFSVGIHHAEMGQRRAAVERIEEGLRLAASIRENRGIALSKLADSMRVAVRAIRRGANPSWPRIESHRP
jgi:predicted metal-dependent hydrolase